VPSPSDDAQHLAVQQAAPATSDQSSFDRRRQPARRRGRVRRADDLVAGLDHGGQVRVVMVHAAEANAFSATAENDGRLFASHAAVALLSAQHETQLNEAVKSTR
jgi:hypothetical protein